MGDARVHGSCLSDGSPLRVNVYTRVSCSKATNTAELEVFHRTAAISLSKKTNEYLKAAAARFKRSNFAQSFPKAHIWRHAYWGVERCLQAQMA